MILCKAGAALGLTGLGAAIDVGGLVLAQYLSDQATPSYARKMSQEEHARNNLGGFRNKYSKVTPGEMALYEGIRQGLMAGEISGQEVNQLAASGALPDRVLTLLMDVHDFGKYSPALPGARSGVSAPESLGYQSAAEGS